MLSFGCVNLFLTTHKTRCNFTWEKNPPVLETKECTTARALSRSCGCAVETRSKRQRRYGDLGDLGRTTCHSENASILGRQLTVALTASSARDCSDETASRLRSERSTDTGITHS